MGRLTVVSTENPYVRYPRLKVTVYDPWYMKKMKISDGQMLYPIRGTISPGEYGGEGEFLHTAHAFASFQDDDYERLIGCYVVVSLKSEVIWAGVLTKVQYQHSASESSGVNQVTYHARDLWHAVADKSIRGVFYGTGFTVGQLLLYLQGIPFTIPTMFGGTSTSPAGRIYLPTNKRGEIIVDINEQSFETGSLGLWSHAYSNIDIAKLIVSVAEEKRFDMVAIKPNALGSDKIGTIEAISYSEVPKTIVIGTPSETDFDTPVYLPKVTSITGDIDLTGCVTEIKAIGGEITQSCAVQLIPAWPTELEEELIVKPVLAFSHPHIYGAVGRVWSLDISPEISNIIPFTEFAEPRYWTEDANWTSHPGNASDSCRIWEYQGPTSDVDKQDDALWKETGGEWIVTQYNSNSTSKSSRFGQMAQLGWFNKTLGLVIFKEPQLRNGQKIDEGTGKIEDDPNDRGPKTLVFQGVRSLGKMGYTTGHKGPFPRPRWRYISNPDWRQHVSTHYTGASNYFGKRYTMGQVGRVENTNNAEIDMTLAMQESAKRVQREGAKPKNSISITISGLDTSWWLGDWIQQVMDTDGNVVKDNLDWYVKEIEYEYETVTTILSMGQRFDG